jgi:integrase/recombinase XerD
MEVDRMNSNLDTFRQDLRLRGLADSTVTRNIGNARRYILWAQERNMAPEQGRREDLLAYLAELRSRGQRQSTLSATFVSLSSWFEYLVESGKLPSNPIPSIQKRYLRNYKDEIRQRQHISVEDAAKMVHATIDTRDRAILLVFLKTGIRRNELITLDLEDLDLPGMSLTLKHTAKRSNRIVFFDEETRRALGRWLKSREMRFKKGDQNALFISSKGTRLQESGVKNLVVEAAMRVGLHDQNSTKLEDKFTPHCCRHWNATHLLHAGMPREFMKWLRGDAMKEAIDIYNHIDPEDVRRSYLAHIPQLGV